jgi:hypothetical protein
MSRRAARGESEPIDQLVKSLGQEESTMIAMFDTASL